MINDKIQNILTINILTESNINVIDRILKREIFYNSLSILSFEEQIKGNYLSSINIKLGYAMEEIIKYYLNEYGIEVIDPDIDFTKEENEGNDYDLVFIKNNILYCFEIKIRDNHDSTKKVGQLNDMVYKTKLLSKLYNIKTIGGFFFVDDAYSKNFKFYQDNLPKEDLLLYGDEFFEYAIGASVISEIIENLEYWKTHNLVDINKTPDGILITDEEFDVISRYKYEKRNNIVENDIIKYLYPSMVRKLKQTL